MTFLLFVLANLGRRLTEWSERERERRNGAALMTWPDQMRRLCAANERVKVRP